jgi:hypothetical protein
MQPKIHTATEKSKGQTLQQPKNQIAAEKRALEKFQ